MKKQQLLDELNWIMNTYPNVGSFESGFRTGLATAIAEIDKLDEPEKVVIPKFVAEWIEEMKQAERPFYSVMSTLMNKTNHEWAVWKSANMNFSEIIAQAWLYGYQFEKEKLYQVIIPTKDKLWKYYYLDGDGGINMVDALENVESHTEEFIRSVSDDLWQFAVEVAEWKSK